MVMEYITGFAGSYPVIAILIISAAVTLVSTLLMRAFTDQEHLKSLKKRQKELQKELKECRKNGDSCQLEKINKEMLELSMKLMKSSFSVKQLLITMIPFLILFQWMRGFFGGEAGVLSSWFWWYLGSAMVFSTIYRKLLKMN